MLEELAEVTGLSMSDVIRMAIRREHKQRVGDTMAERIEAKAERFERQGATEAAESLRDAAKELKRMKPPSLAELARRGFAGRTLEKDLAKKKGKSR